MISIYSIFRYVLVHVKRLIPSQLLPITIRKCQAVNLPQVEHRRQISQTPHQDYCRNHKAEPYYQYLPGHPVNQLCNQNRNFIIHCDVFLSTYMIACRSINQIIPSTSSSQFVIPLGGIASKEPRIVFGQVAVIRPFGCMSGKPIIHKLKQKYEFQLNRYLQKYSDQFSYFSPSNHSLNLFKVPFNALAYFVMSRQIPKKQSLEFFTFKTFNSPVLQIRIFNIQPKQNILLAAEVFDPDVNNIVLPFDYKVLNQIKIFKLAFFLNFLYLEKKLFNLRLPFSCQSLKIVHNLVGLFGQEGFYVYCCWQQLEQQGGNDGLIVFGIVLYKSFQNS